MSQEKEQPPKLPVVNSAPEVEASLAVSSRFLDQSTKVLTDNPTYDTMWAPVVGPENPFAESGLPGNVPRNAVNGLVEACAMDDGVFQANMYAKSNVTKNKRKRQSSGSAADINGFRGPWAADEDELFGFDIEDAEEFDADAEESRKLALIANRVQVKEIEAIANERSEFHGESELDYLGRSYIYPPAGLRPQPHRCYVPKRCVHTWKGHTKAVSKIKFFPKFGHLLLSAGMDGTVKLWDVYNDRKCLRTYYGHSAGVRDIEFTNDGKQFLSASYDKYVKLWDTETGKCISRFTTDRIPYCVRFHPERQHQFLAGQSNKQIVQWDMRSQKTVQRYKEHLGPVNDIAFFDNGRKFISTSDDKKMFVWEYGVPVVIKHISDPTMQSQPCVAVNPAGNSLVSQSMDNQILAYQVGGTVKNNRKKNFSGHECSGYSVQLGFSPDGNFVFSGDAKGRAFFWDWKECRVVGNLRAHEKVTIGCAWHPIEPSRFATCSWDGTIKYWD